jgi:hypothetical protein
MILRTTGDVKNNVITIHLPDTFKNNKKGIGHFGRYNRNQGFKTGAPSPGGF